MKERTLQWKPGVFAAVLLFSSMARSQNAQCTILGAQDFGKVVPVTINPAPALNAVCQVGNETGYVSKTSSGIGVNIDATCRITVLGRTVDAAYEAHPPNINATCMVGKFHGAIVNSFAPVNRPQPPTVPAIPIFYQWEPAANGSVPQFAVIGGYGKVQAQAGFYVNPYYVCRAVFKGSTFPGKVVAKNCNFSADAGKELLAPSYEVLTARPGAFSLVWQSGPGVPPANALIGGQWGQGLDLCQLPYQGGTHPGWAIPAANGQYVCSIGWGGKDVILKAFSYLVPMKGQPID
jgi:hypothetical protein